MALSKRVKSFVLKNVSEHVTNPNNNQAVALVIKKSIRQTSRRQDLVTTTTKEIDETHLRKALH
jgi:hypothetical protein